MCVKKNKNVVLKCGLHENYIFRVIYNIFKITIFKRKLKKILKLFFPHLYIVLG